MTSHTSTIASPTDSMLTTLVEDYARQGHCGPLRVLEPGDAAALWSRIQQFEGDGRNHHLDTPELRELVQDPAITDVVRAILGTDIVLWRSQVICSGGRRTHPTGLTWHQDTYDQLLSIPENGDHCSLQLSFTETQARNAVFVIPGSHLWSDEDFAQRGCIQTRHTKNEVAWSIPRSVESVPVLLGSGEFYVFHPKLLHASALGRLYTPARARAQAANSLPWRVGRKWERMKTRILPLPERNTIAMRFCTSDVEVLPAAYVESPTRNRPFPIP